MIILSLLLILLGLLAWKFKFTLVSRYLLLCGASDVMNLLSTEFVESLHYHKPYQGVGLMIWLLRTTLYLLPASLLLFFLGRSKLKEFSLVSLIVLLFCLYLLYPTIAGSGVLILLTTYYLLCSGVAFVTGLYRIFWTHLKSLDYFLLTAIALATLAEFVMMHLFGYAHYEMMQWMNAMFYGLVALVIVGSPKVKTLIPV